jgi:predicted nuclease of predicted toxin-antitoxin system
MSVKFLTDVGVGKKVEEWLAENDYDVIAIRDLNPGMSDQEILSIAVQDRRLVITMDKDFGEMVYRAGQQHTGVLLLRLEEASGREKMRVVAEIVSRHADKLAGKFCVYQKGRLRIRE